MGMLGLHSGMLGLHSRTASLRLPMASPGRRPGRRPGAGAEYPGADPRRTDERRGHHPVMIGHARSRDVLGSWDVSRGGVCNVSVEVPRCAGFGTLRVPRILLCVPNPQIFLSEQMKGSDLTSKHLVYHGLG